MLERSLHNAALCGAGALCAEAVTLGALALGLPGWQLGPLAAGFFTGLCVYWWGHHVGYGAGLAQQWDAQVAQEVPQAWGRLPVMDEPAE